MEKEQLYTPPAPEKQAEYEAWLAQSYGAHMAEQVAQAKQKLAQKPIAYVGEKMEALRTIEADLVAAFEGGTSAQTAALQAHQDWVGDMWGKPCTVEAYAGLADMYLAHPDFIARYETLSRGFSQWLPAAMKAWASRA